MKALHALVDMLQRNPEKMHVYNVSALNLQGKIALKAEILSVLDEAKIIINDALMGEITNGELVREVSPPFPTCWIQLPEGKTMLVRDQNKKERKIHGVFLNEIEPYYYVFALVVDDPDQVFEHRLQSGYIHTKKQEHTEHYVWDVISSFLQPFAQAHSIGTVKTNERIKFRHEGKKILHKIKTVVHIFPKSVKAREEAEKLYRIEWSHRFAVRGHWRSISGIGKDRAGAYCMKGFTWVVDHVKGPEDKPFIDKTRIVDESFFKKQ